MHAVSHEYRKSYDDMISGNFDSEKVDQNSYVFYYIYFLISSIHPVE